MTEYPIKPVGGLSLHDYPMVPTHRTTISVDYEPGDQPPRSVLENWPGATHIAHVLWDGVHGDLMPVRMPRRSRTITAWPKRRRLGRAAHRAMRKLRRA